MYLKDSDECEVLLRLIDDCDTLVSIGRLEPSAAFTIIAKAAKHHSDYPKIRPFDRSLPTEFTEAAQQKYESLRAQNPVIPAIRPFDSLESIEPQVSAPSGDGTSQT
jgi:hypothetical protein